MKFLVIRFSSIGDIVLTTAAIRCLKQQVPDAEIHFLTKESFKAVTIHNPYISQFHYLKDDLNETIAALKAQNFDWIIDLHKNFRTWRIKTALKVPALTYKKLSLHKFFLTKLGIKNKIPSRHIVDRCIDTLAPLGVQNDGKGLDYFIAAEDHIKAEDLPTAHSAGFIALVMGASYATKKLPLLKLQQLCKKINFPIVLVGGPEDAKEGDAVASIDPIKIYNACGKFSLNESASIVQKSRVVISHDTGLQYVACAFNKPVLAIWGSTSPMLQVEPYYGEVSLAAMGLSMPPYQNFIVPHLTCQPCSNYGTKKCPKGHFNCMMLQDTTAIAAAVEKYL